MRTPLAWLNTISNRSRLCMNAAGIAFAVVLMFTQLGFLNGLFDSAAEIVRKFDADLILLSPARYTVPSEQRFSIGLLNRARSVPGVETALPIYLDRAVSDVRVIGNPSRSIRTVGVPLGQPIFCDPEMQASCQRLLEQDMGLLDRKSKGKYGFERRNLEKLQHQEVELSGKRLRLVDWVTIGTDFVYDGTLIVSQRGVEHFFPFRNGGAPPLDEIDLGLVRLHPDASAIEVQEQLSERLGQQVLVLSREALVRREIRFWATATPIGIIFSIGTVMGLMIGIIICYQILFTDIQDHLAEYATLKAMGYSPSYFLRLVMGQAFYLSAFGFLPGWAISWLLYLGLSEWTGLVMRMTSGRVALVAGLTFLMCSMSGFLAVRKLWSADPATLFK